MSIADDLEKIAIDTLAATVAAGVKEFLSSEPDVAQKAKGALALAQQVADLLPRGELAPFLSDDDAAQALAIARFAKAVKLQGQ